MKKAPNWVPFFFSNKMPNSLVRQFLSAVEVAMYKL